MKSFRLYDGQDHITALAVEDGAKVVPVDSILILVRGMTLNNDVPICMTKREMSLNQDLKALLPSRDVDASFLAYWLLAKKSSLLASVEHAGHGTGKLPTPVLQQMTVHLPPLPEQRAIADVLGLLDDKIELNRRMNRTLESMAQALFKSWFVDFDPVHANAAGKPTLPPDLAALFPDAFESSRVGDIPEGWEVRSLDEIADYLNGLALQKYPAEEGEPTLPRLKIAQLRKGNTEGADLSNTNVPNKYIVQNGDVIFSWSGSLLVRLWTGGKAALNQHLFKVSSDEFPRWFYFLWTQHHLDDFQATAAAKATTMGHIQRHHLSDAKVVVPPASSIASLDAVFSPIIDRLVMNDLESRNLSEIRDSLLSPLLSGEMQINMLKGGEK